MKKREMLWHTVTDRTPVGLDDIHSHAEIPEGTDRGHFIRSGIRAARGAQTLQRRNILTDLAKVLDCSAEDLGFLFMEPIIAANDSDPVAMPDFRATIRAAQL